MVVYALVWYEPYEGSRLLSIHGSATGVQMERERWIASEEAAFPGGERAAKQHLRVEVHTIQP